MAAESAQERTEQPTPKRLADARKKGQVPRSKEFNTTALLLAAATALLIFGGHMGEALQGLFRQQFTLAHSGHLDNGSLLALFSGVLWQALWIMAPFLLACLLAVLLTPLGIGGWSFSTESLGFKFEKLNMVKGFGRIFSLKGLMELVKVLAKFLLVGSVSALILYHLFDSLTALSGEGLTQALAHVARLCGWSFLACSAAMILIAAVDVPFQLLQHNKQLKMTLQEVKDENKETEGRPEVKSRIRALQKELSQQRMMAAVPEADVVITNPTHFAVALRYDPAAMRAPVVVAKGADLVAARIRQIARDHGVALVEAPPLARALYASTEVEQEIPAGLYVAVANVLTYVYQLNQAHARPSAQGGTQAGAPRPPGPEDLPIPDDLRAAMQARRDTRIDDDNMTH